MVEKYLIFVMVIIALILCLFIAGPIQLSMGNIERPSVMADYQKQGFRLAHENYLSELNQNDGPLSSVSGSGSGSSSLSTSSTSGIVSVSSSAPSPLSYKISKKYTINNLKPNKLCLLVVSTSIKKISYITDQFKTYDRTKYSLLLNVYEKGYHIDLSLQNKMRNESDIFLTNIPGIKSTLWNFVGKKFVEDFEYVWFFDDDMVFSKKYFAIDQFMEVAKFSNAVVSSPALMRHNKNARRVRRAYSELFGDELYAETKFIEIGSFMFKSNAWIWFHDTLLLNISDSDWGPDCIWCPLFTKFTDFGSTACAIDLHHSILHLDTRSLGSIKTRPREPGEQAVVEYQKQLDNIFGKNFIKAECKTRQDLDRYIGISMEDQSLVIKFTYDYNTKSSAVATFSILFLIIFQILIIF